MYELLETINTPQALRKLDQSVLPQLAKELRAFLIESISKTGGHLASNLGSVELTIALHYVYDTPHDKLVWDVGHQTYSHKILTGRCQQMGTLRKQGGLSGFPKRNESIYDTFGVGHSSTSIAAALGMAVANYLHNPKDKQRYVAVIGDGALTAGQAFESLNNAGAMGHINLLVVLNDNEMSISRNVGALSNYLSQLLSSRFYNAVRQGSRKILSVIPSVKQIAGKVEEGVKGIFTPGILFEQFGFNYIGPIDGHDLDVLIKTLHNIRQLKGPQFLHVVTRKGYGYKLAEKDPISYHGVTCFDPKNGLNSSHNAPLTYTQVFSRWLCEMAIMDKKLVAITPAMKEGSGLVDFSKQFPDRYFDVGIAEQHAITFAAGLACEGLKPVVAIYSTFLQRGYDQLIHDVALQNLPILFAVDRAGFVGGDGPTHAGAFDLSFLRCIPNIAIMAPSDENECRHMLYTGFLHQGPCVVRYPKGSGSGAVIDSAMQVLPWGCGALKRKGKGKVGLLVFGSLLMVAMKAAKTFDASVADMRFVKPLDTRLIADLAKQHELLVCIEDNAIKGGAGSGVLEWLQQNHINTAMLLLGMPDCYIEQGDQQQQLASVGLNAKGIEQSIYNYFS
jgi:1-deoxy-D-xylulose-5-phosphate synthase